MTRQELTTHELARLLLDGPDVPALVWRMDNGSDEEELTEVTDISPIPSWAPRRAWSLDPDLPGLVIT